MISEIIKTLSDTEVVAIAKEVIDPKVDNLTIYKQLSSKNNEDESIDVNDFAKLTNVVINELVVRLLQRDKDIA